MHQSHRSSGAEEHHVPQKELDKPKKSAHMLSREKYSTFELSAFALTNFAVKLARAREIQSVQQNSQSEERGPVLVNSIRRTQVIVRFRTNCESGWVGARGDVECEIFLFVLIAFE